MLRYSAVNIPLKASSDPGREKLMGSHAAISLGMKCGKKN
jgi:hypothetical protein